MSENKHGRSIGGKGSYIALVLCAAAIGITSYVYQSGREEPAVQTANAPAAITGTVTLPTAPQKPGETAPSTEPTAGKLSVCAPVQGEVLSGYAMEVLSYNETTRDWRVHNGVDLANYQGTPIYAARSGKVTVATYGGTYGNYVTINHGDGYSSLYAHMTRYVVHKGDTVKKGQLIGYMGSTGRSTGPHLHFSIFYNGSSVNPMNYI